MTKYYCRGGVCLENHRKRQLCCWQCVHFAWCRDTGVVGDCQPQTCGKCKRVSNYSHRYYWRIYRKAFTWRLGVDAGISPVRKCLKKKILRGKKHEAKRNRRNRADTHHTPLA